jgi:hypothetical protein
MGSFFWEEHEQRRALMETLFREHWTSVQSYISNKVRQSDVARIFPKNDVFNRTCTKTAFMLENILEGLRYLEMDHPVAALAHVWGLTLAAQ